MWFRPGPFFERFKIAPVLPHTDVRREKREEIIFVEQQAFGLVIYRLRDPGSESDQRLDAGDRFHSHAQIDDNKIGVTGEVDGGPVNLSRHLLSSSGR